VLDDQCDYKIASERGKSQNERMLDGESRRFARTENDSIARVHLSISRYCRLRQSTFKFNKALRLRGRFARRKNVSSPIQIQPT
jgi:intergrase/recombinase